MMEPIPHHEEKFFVILIYFLFVLDLRGAMDYECAVEPIPDLLS
jgi:hypothetical protein